MLDWEDIEHRANGAAAQHKTPISRATEQEWAKQLIEWHDSEEAGLLEPLPLEHAFVDAFTLMAEDVHDCAKEKGWHDKPRSIGEEIALCHSELSEMLEGVRRPGPDRHLPEFSQQEVEAADTIIRLMDMAVKHDLRLAEALVAKVEYNRGRAYRHGGAAI